MGNVTSGDFRGTRDSANVSAAQSRKNVDKSWLHGLILLKLIRLKLHGSVESVEVFARLDEGSAVTLIEKETAHSIGMRGPEFSLVLKGIHDQEAVEIFG